MNVLDRFNALDSVGDHFVLVGEIGVYVGLWNVDFAQQTPSFHVSSDLLKSFAFF